MSSSSAIRTDTGAPVGAEIDLATTSRSSRTAGSVCAVRHSISHLPERADKALSRKSRIHNSRQQEGVAGFRIPCSHRRTGRRRTAWSRWIGAHTPDGAASIQVVRFPWLEYATLRVNIPVPEPHHNQTDPLTRGRMISDRRLFRVS